MLFEKPVKIEGLLQYDADGFRYAFSAIKAYRDERPAEMRGKERALTYEIPTAPSIYRNVVVYETASLLVVEFLP